MEAQVGAVIKGVAVETQISKATDGSARQVYPIYNCICCFYEAVSKKHQNLLYLIKKMAAPYYSALEEFLLPIV